MLKLLPLRLLSIRTQQSIHGEVKKKKREEVKRRRGGSRKGKGKKKKKYRCGDRTVYIYIYTLRNFFFFFGCILGLYSTQHKLGSTTKSVGHRSKL